MNYKEWSKDTKHYELEEGYLLQRADEKEFSVYYTIYKNHNHSFRKSFDISCKVIEEGENCFWIKKENKTVGGVLIEPNIISGLLLIPPFNDEYKVLKMLTKALFHWSDKSKEIEAYTVVPSQVEYYKRLGFKVDVGGRWMIRPTEEFAVSWEADLKVELPRKEEAVEIGEFIYDAFLGGVAEKKLEDSIKWTKYYFENNKEPEILNRASTIIYDKKTMDIVGICLVSMWEEWPLIYDIAVHPSFRGKGIGGKMLEKALTVLKDQFPVLRLYVKTGNPAEAVYYKLGFLPGIEVVDMCIPAVKNSKE